MATVARHAAAEVAVKRTLSFSTACGRGKLYLHNYANFMESIIETAGGMRFDGVVRGNGGIDSAGGLRLGKAICRGRYVLGGALRKWVS